MKAMFRASPNDNASVAISTFAHNQSRKDTKVPAAIDYPALFPQLLDRLVQG